MADPTTWAMPAFAGLIALEAWYDHWQRAGEYSRKDAMTNIALGFGSVLWGFLWAPLQVFVYYKLHDLTPLRMPTNTWWTWVAVMLCDDFFYYWFHRISHESRFFWNFHVVHHSSDHYNLSVAVRQSWFGGIANWLFYAPMALLGFEPWMIIAAHGFNLLYQFWIHTQFIKSLGWWENILNTPSHHRVHHGVNEPYLDRNYGGILIIWDRLFGSYVRETEKPRYGIIKPLNSFNPLWANLHGWVEMVEAMKTQPTLWKKLRCVWGPPGMN